MANWLGKILARQSAAPPAGFFAATDGTAGGDGSFADPWDLATALAQPAALIAGSTLYVRGGSYVGNFTSTILGSAGNPIVVTRYPGERPILDGNIIPAESGSPNPVLTIAEAGGYTNYIDFEVTNTSTVRTDTEACTWCRGDGINLRAPNAKVINCVVHDTGQGITSWDPATNSEVFGNLSYYIGWTALPSGTGIGHAQYTQNNAGGSKLISDNIMFDGKGLAIQAYGSSGAAFKDSTVIGNMHWRQTAIYGGLSGFRLTNSHFDSNYVYKAAQAIGYHNNDNTDVFFEDSFCWNPTNTTGCMYGPEDVSTLPQVTIAGCTFIGGLGNFVAADKPANTYYDWDQVPASNLVVVRANAYEANRANIYVFNFEGLSSVSVDLTGFVANGTSYKIINAQDWFGTPVATGTYGGGSVSIGMTGLAVGAPIGFSAPATTGPDFACFVVRDTGKAQ